MGAINLIYPNAIEAKRIAQDLMAIEEKDDVAFGLFPVENADTFFVRWYQMDNDFGIMAMRGLDGAPSKVQQLGDNSYLYEPGVYGEFMEIGEREILTRAAPLTPTMPVPIDDLVGMRQKQLVNRSYNRVRYNIWTLLGTGTLTVPLNGPSGANVYLDTYNIQTFASTVPWSVTATATPIRDLQQMQQLQVGHSVDMGSRARLFMNQITANQMVNNSNAADLGGRRNSYGATLNNVPDMTNYFAAQNLPKPEVYDKGFQPFPNNGPLAEGPNATPPVNFQKFIPTGTGILIGARNNGDPIGHMQKTIQSMQPGTAGGRSSGDYSFVYDSGRGINGPLRVPAVVQVNAGFNGGPALEFASSVVSANLG